MEKRPLSDGVDLGDLAWPSSRLGEAVELLGRKAGLLSGSAVAPGDSGPPEPAEDEALDRWVDGLAAGLGIEAEPVRSTFADVDRMVRGAGPALLRLPESYDVDGPRFLALLSGGWSFGGKTTLIGSDGKTRRVRAQLVCDALCKDIVSPWLAPLDALLAEAGVAEDRRDRARQAIVREQVAAQVVGGGWLLRLSPGASVWRQTVGEGLWRPVAMLLAATVCSQLLLMLSWWLVGRGALAGRFETIWIAAWGLVIFTSIPVQILASTCQAKLAIGGASIVKQRLLYGALRLAPDSVRHLGLGQFIARINQSEVFESMGLGTGLTSIVSAVQLISASALLAMGIGGWPHAALLLLWTALVAIVGFGYYRSSEALQDFYNTMSNSLVERMVGHRTRLAQEDHRRWHAEEDQELDHYLRLSREADRAGVILAAVPSSWLVAGLGGIAYAMLAGGPVGRDSLPWLAISVGGVLLAWQSLGTVVAGVGGLIAALLSWKQVAPLFQPAGAPENGHFSAGANIALGSERPSRAGGDKPLQVARDLCYRYGGRGRAVLRECRLQIREGDRLLLEGPSGGGKSTLAAVLAGLRDPESGLLLLWGYDRHSLGQRVWRQRVAMAPQFHENHIFTGTLAFNLVMGRRWPATDEDLAEAEGVCRELGLGELIERMPSEMQQIVGESGWQLSHGERSRIFIARALLHGADLVIFDESFGSLDPENLLRALRCAIERSRTLLVIAHP
ncbi:MAG: ABC transporter ATP-binding protein [Chloroflexi bacterium]|nr:ABC transporter ATP-binding protein [Chloroflexota bacterium]